MLSLVVIVASLHGNRHLLIVVLNLLQCALHRAPV